MRKWISLLLLLTLLLGSPAAHAASASLAPTALPAGAQPAAGTPRLVVFEGFYDLSSYNSKDAGLAVDKLASEYAAAGKPVVFLEQNHKYTTWFDLSRLERFGAATTGASYPGVLLDSGNKWAFGVSANYYNTYKALVDAELARAPLASVSATQMRVANHLEFEVLVKNLSGMLLYKDINDATVTVIVYEDITKDPAKGVTSHIDRAVVYQGVATPMKDNVSAKFSMRTRDLLGVNWSKLHSVAFVDYRPGGYTGPYEMLQAAMVTGPTFSLQPNSLTFLVDQAHPGDPQAPILTVGSPSAMTWVVTSKPAWVTVVPDTGIVGDKPVVRVDASALQPGLNSGTIRFTATILKTTLTRDVTVKVTYNPTPSLSAEPTDLAFMVDPTDLSDPEQKVKVTGWPTTMQWYIGAKPTWVTVLPNKGAMGSSAAVRIDSSALKLGLNSGSVRFSAVIPGTTTILNSYVDVKVIKAHKLYNYLPSIQH